MKVFLVANTRFLSSYKRFLRGRNLTWRRSGGPNTGQQLVEFAGRVCYLSFGKRQSPKSNAAYVKNLIQQGHESVLEHASYSILVEQISRGLSHQLVRHRAGFSYSQLSQQYHDESDAEHVIPPGLDGLSQVAQTWRSAVSAAGDSYKRILRDLSSSAYGAGLGKKERLRAVRSVARSVLPNATATVLVMTGNARAWRHLFKIRGAIAGDLEMREFCVQVFRLLRREAPDLFNDLMLKEDTHGKFVAARP